MRYKNLIILLLLFSMTILKAQEYINLKSYKDSLKVVNKQIKKIAANDSLKLKKADLLIELNRNKKAFELLGEYIVNNPLDYLYPTKSCNSWNFLSKF